MAQADSVVLRDEKSCLSALARRKPSGRGLEQTSKSRVSKLGSGYELAVVSSLTARVPQREEMVDVLGGMLVRKHAPVVKVD